MESCSVDVIRCGVRDFLYRKCGRSPGAAGHPGVREISPVVEFRDHKLKGSVLPGGCGPCVFSPSPPKA